MSACCKKCGIELDAEGDQVRLIVGALNEIAEGADSVFQIKTRVRRLALMLGGMCAGCAFHERERDWHKCRRCLRRAYEPLTRCSHCGGELFGVRYPMDAA